MKKYIQAVCMVIIVIAVLWVPQMTVLAKEETTIHNGIYAGEIDLSGMTEEEAKAAVEDYVDEVETRAITLQAVEGNDVTVTAADLGLKWTNPDIIEEAAAYGSSGNIIARYKELKDLENNSFVYDLEYSFEDCLIKQIIEEQCMAFDQHAQNASMERVNGQFVITDEVAGIIIDEEASIDVVKQQLADAFIGEDLMIELVGIIDEPTGTREQLEQIQDVIGTYTTSFSSSGVARSANVTNGCSLINGTVVYPGEEFSAYNTVKPFTSANGYYMAGSYLNGMVVDSMGGGICQVSTTLYNAVLGAELEVVERNNHSMVVSYVQISADAAISESSGKDFRFVNNTEYPIYIEGITENKKITFNIYGVETRPENRTVEYVNEILQQIVPDSERIIPDAGQGVGYVNVQSAHIGYKARLWKIVKVDGVEVSREQVNSSSYSMSPRTATVGVNTADPGRYEEIMAAIGTANIDHVKGIAAQLYAQEVAAAAAAQPQPQPAE